MRNTVIAFSVANVLALTAFLTSTATVSAQNWPSFRGAGAKGVVTGQDLPNSWNINTGTNVRWKKEISGISHASPVVWGDRVFVVTVEGPGGEFSPDYGGIDTADEDRIHTWKLLALDKLDGDLIWAQAAYRAAPRIERHHRASLANATPATNGRYVVGIFGSQGMVCLEVEDGSVIWKKDLGLLDMGLLDDPTSQWGSASSPVIFEDVVIVQCDKRDGPFLAAYYLATGELKWKTPRDELNVWSSPVIYRGEHGPQVVTNGGNHLRGYDARTGEPLWHYSDHAEVKTPTPVVAGDVFYLTGGYPPGRPITAIKAAARGEVSLDNGLMWRTKRGGPYTMTPIVYRGLFYTCSDGGVLSCYDAQTGERVYRERLGGNFSASPVAADGKVYFSNHEGEIYIVKAGRDYELLSKQDMNEPIMATPVISDGLFLIRTSKHIYAIGKVAS